MCGVALAGLLTAIVSDVVPAVVVGTGAGVLLLGYAVMSLARAVRPA
jgi:hypothetical protein